MERKYYMRGLGLGILVTAIIMGIVLPSGKKMTDADVIARAKELGMKEETVLSDTRKDEAAAEKTDAGISKEDTEDTPVPAEPENPENIGTQPKEEEEMEPELSEEGAAGDGTAAGSLDDTVPANAANTDDEPEISEKSEDNSLDTPEVVTPAIKTITIVNGDGSYSVAKKLANAGVVTSAENYDNYLCENGYDKKLRTGVFSIPSDASDEQIARIITGRE